VIVWERRDVRLSSSEGLGVRDIRTYVRRALEGVEHSFDLDDVDLMVCEIATNAVRHTDSGLPGGGVRVSVLVSATRLRVEVQDEGGARGRPIVPAQRGGLSESGRGLMIVDGLADRWGIVDGQDGVSVWFEVASG
jgi:anti-sigma regulatory factor (Ser/Thr protein kinase)